MKRGTTPIQPIRFNLLNSDIQSISFIFKQEKSEKAPVLLTKNYSELSESQDIEYIEETNVYNIRFTAAETYLFEAGKPFYMDTKIVLANGILPEIPIITFNMEPTLFAEVNNG